MVPNHDDEEEERRTPLPEQQAFIDRAGEAHGLLVAGPGTGKTFTLEHLSGHIVEQLGYPGESIEVVTLTRSMAAKLKEKIPYGNVETLHAFALRQLNAVGEATGRRIPDEWEKKELIRRDLLRGAEDAFPNAEVSMDHVDEFLKKLQSGFRADQEGPEDLTEAEERIERVYQRQRELFQYRLLAELAVALVRLIDQGTELEGAPDFVLVDEYQDLTAGELRLLQLLAERFGTWLLVCGDDRQSIYGFRDANREAIQRFQEVYNLDSINVLRTSKRLPALLCEFAEEIARILPDVPGVPRPPLEPWPGREDEGELQLVSAPSPPGEARWVRDECRRLVEEEGYQPWEIMIITSSFNAQINYELKEAEDEADDLPFGFYQPGSGGPDIEGDDIRLLSAGVRLMMDREDHLAWRTLVELTPNLGDVRITGLLTGDGRTFFDNLETQAGTDARVSVALRAGRHFLDEFGHRPSVDPIRVVECLGEQLGIEDTETVRVEALANDSEEELTPSEWAKHLIELQYSQEVSPEERPDMIPVRTIFGAKGLDAPVVFLMNAQEECFTGRGDPDEGLRKLYVAITRAEERLYISAPRYLEHWTLGHAMERVSGSLAPNIVRAAGTLGVTVDRQS